MQNRRKIHFIKKRFQARFIALFCILVFLGSMVIGIVLYYTIDNRLTGTIYHSHIKVRTVGEIVGPAIFRVNAIVTLCIIAIGFLLTYIILKRIERRLLPFKVYSDRLAEGDLTVRAPEQEDDLTDELGEGFNAMVDGLKERFKTIKMRLSTIDNLLQKIEDMAEEKKDTAMIEPLLKEVEREVEGMKNDAEGFKV